MFHLSKYYLLFFVLASAVSGCMLSRVLVSEELMLVRGTAFRATATRIAITDEALAMRSIARLRIKPGTLGKPILYLPEAGLNRPLFEIINQSTVKRIATGEIYSLPFRIFRVNGVAKAQLRTGPGVSYKLYKTLPKDKFVLVRDEIPGWYYVQADDLLGWIAVAALSSAVSEKKGNSIKYTRISCYNCDSTGTKECEDCLQSGYEDCPSCKGAGWHKCNHCSYSGWVKCSVCKENIVGNCPLCKGTKYVECVFCKATGRFDCTICHNVGKIPCEVCDGTLHTKCYYCYGTMNVSKRNK